MTNQEQTNRLAAVERDVASLEELAWSNIHEYGDINIVEYLTPEQQQLYRSLQNDYRLACRLVEEAERLQSKEL